MTAVGIASRTLNGVRCVCIEKLHALLCKPVDVRRPDVPEVRAATVRTAITEIISQIDDDVWGFLSRTRLPEGG